MSRVKKLRAELTRWQTAHGKLVCQVGILEGRIKRLENLDKIYNCENHIWLISRLYRAYGKDVGTETHIIFKCFYCGDTDYVSLSQLNPQQRKIALAAGIKLPRKKL